MTSREHDKGPEEFCSILTKMIDADLEFVVSVLGEHTNDVPGIVWDSSHYVLCTCTIRGNYATGANNDVKYIKFMSDSSEVNRYCLLYELLQSSTYLRTTLLLVVSVPFSAHVAVCQLQIAFTLVLAATCREPTSVC